MAATARQERELRFKYEKLKLQASDPLELLRAHVLAKGVCSLKSLNMCVFRSSHDCGFILEFIIDANWYTGTRNSISQPFQSPPPNISIVELIRFFRGGDGSCSVKFLDPANQVAIKITQLGEGALFRVIAKRSCYRSEAEGTYN